MSEDKVKKLRQKELDRILIQDLETKVAYYEARELDHSSKVIKHKKEMLLKEGELLDYRMKEIDSEKSKKIQLFESKKQRNLDYANSLKDKYKIKSDKWGYDPLSGEIKED